MQNTAVRDEAPPAAGPRARVAQLGNAIPTSCYDNPTSLGLAIFARDAAIYFAALALLIQTTSLCWAVVGWIVAANAISALFVLGHDAAHGALFRSRALNYLVGQLAMLPSLHAFSVWAYGHNRIHHAFSCCRDLDFVWHPNSPAEFAGMSGWRRWRHRLEWSAFGAGIYYARAMWWGKIVRGAPPRGMGGSFLRDRTIVAGFALVFGGVMAAIGWRIEPTLQGSAWMVGKTFVLPWLLWNAMIGWAIYIQHIHPHIAWMERRQWNREKGWVEGTTNYQVPKVVNLIWHNIFDHTAHHLDPRIPFYRLPAATAALRCARGELTELAPYRLRDYVEVTRRCKLFDFDRGVWVDYTGRPAVESS